MKEEPHLGITHKSILRRIDTTFSKIWFERLMHKLITYYAEGNPLKRLKSYVERRQEKIVLKSRSFKEVFAEYYFFSHT